MILNSLRGRLRGLTTSSTSMEARYTS